MASALDKALNEYKPRPKDESGARKTKVSLIYDPREASFIDTDTFYQIGYQGFTELCEKETRIAKFSKSVFAYSNTQIDPLFLTTESNKKIFEKIEKLLFLLSDYIMEKPTIKIIEYLIQQFAVNRLRPDLLLIIFLPYLETSLFVRVAQTIPFKNLLDEFKYLKLFGEVATSKYPINRRKLIEWINDKPAILQWIIRFADRIVKDHPHGTFASFMGVLMTEIALSSKNDVNIRAVINSAKNAFSTKNASLAIQTIMSIVSLNERHPLQQDLLDTFMNGIFNLTQMLDSDFSSSFKAAVYFCNYSAKSPTPDYIIKLCENLQELSEITKRLNVNSLSRKCVQVVSTNLDNELLVRSTIAILETSFFENVASEFFLSVAKHFKKSELTEQLIDSIASHYPSAITPSVLDSFKAINITIKPTQLTKQSLINQLSDPNTAGSLYSNPDLPYDIACEQVLHSLSAAESSGNTEVISPLLKYFAKRMPEDLMKYLYQNIFLTGSNFSKALNKALNESKRTIDSFFSGLPDKNVDIINFLKKKKKIPEINVFPLALARAYKDHNYADLLKYLPKTNVDYELIREKVKVLKENNDFVIDSREIKAALILNTIEHLATEIEFDVEDAIELFDFPDFKSIAPIIKNISNISIIMAAFEKSLPSQKRVRTNILIYIGAVVSKAEDPYLFLPASLLGLTYPEHLEQTIMLLKSFPLKNKEVKSVLSPLLRQTSVLHSDEKSIHFLFDSIASNNNNQEFFNHVWEKVQTCEGCSRFWKLTNNIGIVSAIKRFTKDPNTPTFFKEVIAKFNTSEELKKWALDSKQPYLIQAVIPYLGFDLFQLVLQYVCAYPRFFAEAFKSYFVNLEIDASKLKKFVENTKGSLTREAEQPPPEEFKSTPKQLISESVLILEHIPFSTKIKNLHSLAEPLIKLLQKNVVPTNLIYNIFLSCYEDASKTLLKHFAVIIDSISQSTLPHIHASALKLIQLLTLQSPAQVSKHATALFTTLNGATLYADDSANLQKLKQILSSVLPVLSKKNEIDPLLDFLSENIDQFSFDRATQLTLHMILTLKDDSFKVFYSLLKAKKQDFALHIVDQLEDQVLLKSLIRLCETDVELEEFVTKIQLPPLPNELLKLFIIMSNKFDCSEYFQNTLNSFSIMDFIAFINVIIPSSFASEKITDIIKNRIQDEPSDSYAALLPSLVTSLNDAKFDSIISILNDIVIVVSVDEGEKFLNAVEKVIRYIDNNDDDLIKSIQAVGFAANACQKFNIVSMDVFPKIVRDAQAIFDYTIKNGEEKLPYIIPHAGTVCLLLATSPDFCLPSMNTFLKCLISPAILEVVEGMPNDIVRLVENTLTDLTMNLKLDSLMQPILKAYEFHKEHPVSLVLLFKILRESLKNSESTIIQGQHTRLMKFFWLVFGSTRNNDWDKLLDIQDAVISTFVVFVSILNENLFGITFNNFISFFGNITQDTQIDYVINRVIYVRAVHAIAEEMQRSLAMYYQKIIFGILQLSNEANNAEKFERDITYQCMKIITNMCKNAKEGFFDATIFNNVLEAIIKHTETIVETPEEYDEKIINAVAPAFSYLMQATQDDILRRTASNKICELMSSTRSIIKKAALRLLDESFKVVGAELLSIMPEVAPSFYELIEDTRDDVGKFALSTKLSIANSVNDNLDTYFQ